MLPKDTANGPVEIMATRWSFVIFQSRVTKKLLLSIALRAEESSKRHTCNFPKMPLKYWQYMWKMWSDNKKYNLLSFACFKSCHYYYEVFWEPYSVIIFIEIISKKINEHFTGISECNCIMIKRENIFSLANSVLGISLFTLVKEKCHSTFCISADSCLKILFYQGGWKCILFYL